jgi:hypothetical protein
LGENRVNEDPNVFRSAKLNRISIRRMPPDLVSVPKEEWQAAVERFEILKPLITTDRAKRTLTDIKRAARVLGGHPVTVYRWIIENYKRCERLSVFLRKRRSDRGTSRLSSNVEKLIDTAV